MPTTGLSSSRTHARARARSRAKYLDAAAYKYAPDEIDPRCTAGSGIGGRKGRARRGTRCRTEPERRRKNIWPPSKFSFDCKHPASRSGKARARTTKINLYIAGAARTAGDRARRGSPPSLRPPHPVSAITLYL